MAAMAPALTDPAPDARNLHFKLAPPSSSLPLGETNGGCLPPPDPPDLVASYGGTPGKETLKLGGVYTPRSILSQSLCRGRSSILEFNLEELRGITNSSRGGQGGPLNGLAKRPAKPAVDKPPSLSIPALEPWVKAPPVPPGSPDEEHEQKGSRVQNGSDARLKALLQRHGEMEKRARSIQKRLQVVQAKQVERHLHQQLGGLVGAAFGRNTETPRSRLTVVTRKADAQRRGEAVSSVSEALLKGAATELERLSCSGSATLRACERGFDSDATESSSGGDSDVEEDEPNRVDTQQSHVPLKRRCEWTWARERADVVSRWNWLQAHVSDLEYRIRQHTDFYRQLRAGKGQVLLGDAGPSESCVGDPDGRTAVSTSLSVDPERKAEPGTTEPKILQKPINGVVMLPKRSSSDAEEQTSSKSTATVPDSSCVCARTRPVLHCKRRRVVRPDRILPLHRKVQSSVPRPCEVSSSCVMCASFPGLSTQFPYSDPLSERLTLLDPAIHPVLSFPADVPAGLRLHALLRSHNKMDRFKSSRKVKQRPSNPGSTTTEIHRTDRTPGVLHTHKLTLHRPFPELSSKQHLDPLLRTLKCERSQALKTERSLSLPIPHQKKRYFSPIERDGRHEMEPAGPSPAADREGALSHTPLSRQLSTSSDSSISAAAAAARKRRMETSYDIDNIVIPMSVAATTRVERLQYKEILTPSWRVVKITPLTPNSDADIEELEDLSDSAFAALHLKCEESERARWASSSLPPQRRGSRTHRTSEGSMTSQLSIGTQALILQPPSPDTSSWQAMPDFSPLSPDVLSAPPTPTSRDTPRLISEETQSSVSDSGYEETIVHPWEKRHFPLSYNPKPEIAGTSEPSDWGGPRPSRRSSCSSRTAKDTEGPPSSPPCPSSRPRPLHR
ncbi:PREDICTED: KAT8 regulatory NSL complex subunit 1-like [Nanorana parkeri]|uniref:KAT8 regulatory NSL complex subunit 1-like n=1 Tax=Nanorana parkeri TaxID=125878 RepID=UPI000854CE38|nr:PREDICTED: KAT8 regulatory NSL complex subunit 1-like [Nanorana parkeri]